MTYNIGQLLEYEDHRGQWHFVMVTAINWPMFSFHCLSMNAGGQADHADTTFRRVTAERLVELTTPSVSETSDQLPPMTDPNGRPGDEIEWTTNDDINAHMVENCSSETHPCIDCGRPTSYFARKMRGGHWLCRDGDGCNVPRASEALPACPECGTTDPTIMRTSAGWSRCFDAYECTKRKRTNKAQVNSEKERIVGGREVEDEATRGGDSEVVSDKDREEQHDAHVLEDDDVCDGRLGSGSGPPSKTEGESKQDLVVEAGTGGRFGCCGAEPAYIRGRPVPHSHPQRTDNPRAQRQIVPFKHDRDVLCWKSEDVENIWVAAHPWLDIISQGRTRAEAIRSLLDAVAMIALHDVDFEGHVSFRLAPADVVVQWKKLDAKERAKNVR